MSQKNFYASKMILKSIDELKNYLNNREDFQEDAVFAAILELEKRGIPIDESEKIKEELSDIKTIEPTIENDDSSFQENTLSETPELYSTKFIYIFGALFSVFGGGILMALNFMTLKNKKAARLTILASIGYSIIMTFLIDALGIPNLLISLGTSLLGVYLLHYFIWNRETPPSLDYKEKDIWKPIVIGLLVALPLAYLMMITGNIPQ